MSIGSVQGSARKSWADLSEEVDTDIDENQQPEVQNMEVLEHMRAKSSTDVLGPNARTEGGVVKYFPPSARVFWNVRGKHFGKSGKVIEQMCFGALLMPDILVRFRGCECDPRSS